MMNADNRSKYIRGFLCLCLAISAQLVTGTVSSTAQQAQTLGTTLTATTKDGRQVLLKSDGTWTYAAAVGQPSASSHVLSLETGIVMKSGDVKPAARTDFYLLDRDLVEILQTAGYKKGPGPLDDPIFNFYREQEFGDIVKNKSGNAQAALAGIREHTVSSAVTDFTGKGKFTAPTGTYYVFSISRVGNNTIIWNLKVELISDQILTLDTRNAAKIY